MLSVLAVRNAIKIGGAELYLMNLARALKKYYPNIRLTLLSNNHKVARETVDVFNEEIGTKKGILRFLPRLSRYLIVYATAIKKINPDVIIFSGMTEKLALTIPLRLMGKKIVWLEHGRVFATSRAREITAFYYLASRFANAIAAESRDTARDLAEGKITKKKIQPIGTGVDTDHFSFYQRAAKTLTVGFVATVCWEKGIKQFMQTAAALKSRKIKFLVVGDGPQLAWAKNKNPGSVQFVGYQADTRPFLAEMDIILSPISHPGGLSLSVAQAMATGAVPIVSDVGGNSQLVTNNVNGLVTADPTTAVLRLNQNRKQLKKLSAAAREKIAADYSWQRWANGWQQILCRL
ncbi:MAG: glycosyltransferase family 4 protein [Patescibacteria group bacterium]|nr:glycosyltransferase family 4 protein [Patescibacteria group bacterium]MCL5431751.1 glycosyltransferase family 4 protein [Patescibacteria group bacterium]